MSNDLTLGTALDGQPATLELRALTTHAFCLGMTGSGKTGLCVDTVEELVRQGVSVIAVDSKGDLGTLLLSIDPQDSAALARWGGSQERVEKALAAVGLTRDDYLALKQKVDVRFYTPGSSLGLPLDLLGSLAPPPQGTPDAQAEAIDGIIRPLLGLVGVEADPLTSREYLLLGQIISTAWAQGQTPTLVDLIRYAGTPPFQTVGALPLDDFFPQKDRQGLMVRLNGLVASPRFAAWRTGEPFTIETLVNAPDGRPRLSIYSVAHLSDDDRLFAVSALLERVQLWMRRQGGSNTVRLAVLIDEILGYFPPAPANPPTKPPLLSLLSLLKQARAFGVSVILATQNAIDLDYRGLANIGTWLVGRLQTSQDKQRIRDALVSAASASGVTPAELDTALSKLEPRQFLLHSVHQEKPQVFRTRDTMTVLHGPLSADQITELTAPMRAAAAGGAPAAQGGVTPQAQNAGLVAAGVAVASAAPIGIDPELGPLYEVDRGQAVTYLLLKFGVRYRVGKVTSEETVHELAFPLEGSLGPAEALEGEPLSVKGVPFQNEPPPGMALPALPSWPTAWKAQKVVAALRDRLPSKLETKLLVDAQTKLVSSPVETAEAFTARVLAKQGASKDTQKLIRELEKKKADLDQADRELSARKAEKWVSVGTSVLGLFSGRRSSLSGVTRAMSTQRRQGSAEASLEDRRIEVQQLEHQLAGLKELDPSRFEEQVAVPRPSDVQLLRVAIAFIVP